MKYLITGGTGYLGHALVKHLSLPFLNNIDEIRVFSRDEFKQSEMARHIEDSRITYWLGDVRNLERLKEAAVGVDVIIHTAAMKRMDTISRNAYEVAEVNIMGSRNVAIAGRNCRSIILVSTDKAYAPSCVYGASKLIAEAIFLAEKNGCVWRFGNFIGSRGSVWEIFEEQKKAGKPLTITDPEATRFIISVDDVCKYILADLDIRGLNYPLKLKAKKIIDIANDIVPEGFDFIRIGLRENEKKHEAFNEEYSSDKCL